MDCGGSAFGWANALLFLFSIIPVNQGSGPLEAKFLHREDPVWSQNIRECFVDCDFLTDAGFLFGGKTNIVILFSGVKNWIRVHDHDLAMDRTDLGREGNFYVKIGDRLGKNKTN